MTVADWLTVSAAFSVGTYLGALGGLLAGLTVGWAAGRWRRTTTRETTEQQYRRQHRTGSPMAGGQVVMGPNQPRPQPQTRIPSAPPRGEHR